MPFTLAHDGKIQDRKLTKNTHNTQTKDNPEKANNAKHSKTKQNLLQHSARWVGLFYNAHEHTRGITALQKEWLIRFSAWSFNELSGESDNSVTSLSISDLRRLQPGCWRPECHGKQSRRLGDSTRSWLGRDQTVVKHVQDCTCHTQTTAWY